MAEHNSIQPYSPQAALEMLLDGNQRFVENRGEYAAASQSDDALLERLAEGQKPYAVVIGCSDSRTPPELLFDEGLGRIFVIRVAGNVIDTVGAASVQYAIENAGAKLVLLLGHTSCGAITAVAEAGHEILPGDLEVFQTLMPGLVDRHSQTAEETQQEWVDRLANVNAVLQAHRLLQRCESLREKVRTGACGLAAARYDLQSGAVELIGDGLIRRL